MKEKGSIQIYTGTGKGKSTAAFGLALRASGWGLRTVIIQFMKTEGGSGESSACAALPLISIYAFGSGNFLRKGTKIAQVDLDLAKAAIAKAEEAFADPATDIVILDELNNALYFDLVSEADCLSLISKKRPDQELIITGRNAPQCLIDLADLVTDMQAVKHPGDKGVNARRGIEY